MIDFSVLIGIADLQDEEIPSHAWRSADSSQCHFEGLRWFSIALRLFHRHCRCADRVWLAQAFGAFATHGQGRWPNRVMAGVLGRQQSEVSQTYFPLNMSLFSLRKGQCYGSRELCKAATEVLSRSRSSEMGGLLSRSAAWQFCFSFSCILRPSDI